MTARDWRAGELTMLLLALVLAVAALASVGFLADRMHHGLERDARQMIAADFVVRADHPVDPAFAQEAAALEARDRDHHHLPQHDQRDRRAAGVAARGDQGRVAGLSAARRGADRARARRRTMRPRTAIPAPGTVWLDPPLLDALKTRVGGTVKVGTRTFTMAAVITRELDRGFGFVNFSPRLMMRADELASTGLIGYGSRVTYRLLVAGPDAQVERFATWARARVDGGKLRGVNLESLQDGQPQVRQTIDRASHFLTLVSLLTALLAAVAIAMAAHRFARRHLDGCAAMRCLGVSQWTLRSLFIGEFLTIGVLGSVAGRRAGFRRPSRAAELARHAGRSGIAVAERLARARKASRSGSCCCSASRVPPLLPLTRVPPVHVLRREIGGEAARRVCRLRASACCCSRLLLVLAAGELKLGGIVAGGFAGGLAGVRRHRARGALGGGALRAARARRRGRRLAVCAGVARTAQRRERAADHGARHRPDVPAADRDDAQRPDRRLAQRHAARRAEPVPDRHPAGPARRASPTI